MYFFSTTIYDLKVRRALLLWQTTCAERIPIITELFKAFHYLLRGKKTLSTIRVSSRDPLCRHSIAGRKIATSHMHAFKSQPEPEGFDEFPRMDFSGSSQSGSKFASSWRVFPPFKHRQVTWKPGIHTTAGIRSTNLKKSESAFRTLALLFSSGALHHLWQCPSSWTKVQWVDCRGQCI